jgi:hypothetical protein
VELITEKRKTGVTLTVLGFGSGNLNDSMMEKISNAGNGVYAVIANADQAVDTSVTEAESSEPQAATSSTPETPETTQVGGAEQTPAPTTQSTAAPETGVTSPTGTATPNDFDGDGRADSSDLDDDNDGLPDVIEAQIGSQPFNPDTDGDGLQDGTEYGISEPLLHSLGGRLVFQVDVDPLTTTDPTDPDTDNDGFCDGANSVAGVCVGGEDTNNDGASDQALGSATNAQAITTVPVLAGGATTTARNTTTATDPQPAGPITATIIGSGSLVEGDGPASYRISLDRPVAETTRFVVDASDGSANRTEDPDADLQKIAFHQPWPNHTWVDGKDEHDFTVRNGGVVVAGQFTVVVPAGSTSSEPFTIEAWAEEVALHTIWEDSGALAGRRPSGFEGTENFKLDIVQATGGSAEFNLIDRTINIEDLDLYTLI